MKAIAILLIALMALLAVAPGAMAEGQGRGGLAGAVIGCCFGIRSAAAYNDGKDLHWREWIRIIPIANWVGAVYDGVDGMNGVSTKDLESRYGSNYY